MRLKAIRTDKLFGMFDHLIPLNLDQRITIIHGPNGFGKTAILRLIAGFFNRRYHDLYRLPFAALELQFDNDKSLTISKFPTRKDMPGGAQRRDDVILEYDSKKLDLNRLLPDGANFPISMVEEYAPYLVRVGPREWLDRTTGETIGIEDLAVRLPDTFPPNRKELDEPRWLQELRDSFSVHYIQAHRLESFNTPTARSHRTDRAIAATASVDIYAQDLASRIQSTLARYAELSQSLDRTFPHRLLAETDAPAFTLENLAQRLNSLEQKRKALMDVGLLDKELHALSVPQITPAKIDTLSVYVKDAKEKLSVFDELFERIRLFQTIINKRFLFKSLSISKQDGFMFHTHTGMRLLPSALSTGEQHEVVLLYELLFRVTKNSLILVDEPEISLHIAWQEQFLRDLREITAITEFDVLIATHSPQIISDRWDLTVELRGPNVTN